MIRLTILPDGRLGTTAYEIERYAHDELGCAYFSVDGTGHLHSAGHLNKYYGSYTINKAVQEQRGFFDSEFFVMHKDAADNTLFFDFLRDADLIHLGSVKEGRLALYSLKFIEFVLSVLLIQSNYQIKSSDIEILQHQYKIEIHVANQSFFYAKQPIKKGLLGRKIRINEISIIEEECPKLVSGTSYMEQFCTEHPEYRTLNTLYREGLAKTAAAGERTVFKREQVRYTHSGSKQEV